MPFLGSSDSKASACNAGNPGLIPYSGRSMSQEGSLEKELATHSSILAWEIPWRWSLVGYSQWGRKESDMTERPMLLM